MYYYSASTVIIESSKLIGYNSEDIAFVLGVEYHQSLLISKKEK